MATIPVGVDENLGAGEESGKGIIRVILADTQAIFRAGLRKIFALEDDIRVVGQAETLAQAQTAVKKFSADVLVFESALAPNPVEAVASFVSQSPTVRVVVVTPTSRDEDLTLELFRRGAHGILSREVEPEIMVDCLRKVAAGESWLDSQGTHWVMEAYRNQNSRPSGGRAQGAADSERNPDRFLRDAGDEEQRDRSTRRHDRAGREKLSAKSLRQAGRGGSPGTGALLPESPRRGQHQSAADAFRAGLCSGERACQRGCGWSWRRSAVLVFRCFFVFSREAFLNFYS